MTRAQILCVGRLKEPFYAAACAEYEKRLSRYLKLQCVEVDDEREPKAPSDALNRRVTAREGERLLARVAPDDYVIALCVGGAELDSEAFARRLSALADAGRRVTFVIGGSLGLSDGVLARADEKLSLSRMTFPHQLARVVLLEQLYRAQKILSGERYHK